MVNGYQLAWRGVKWSYDEYGLKGALAFVGIIALGYHLFQRKLADVFDGDETVEPQA